VKTRILLTLCCVVSAHILHAQEKPSRSSPPQFGYLSDGIYPNGTATALSPAEASRIAQQLDAHPEDSEVLGKLLKYYWYRGLREPRLQLIFWLIENHPESDLHGFQTAGIFPEMSKEGSATWYPAGNPLNSAEDYAHAADLWQRQVDRHPKDAPVLFNAARALGFAAKSQSDIALVEQAQRLDPESIHHSACNPLQSVPLTPAK
jgi:hypothetical protein